MLLLFVNVENFIELSVVVQISDQTTNKDSTHDVGYPFMSTGIIIVQCEQVLSSTSYWKKLNRFCNFEKNGHMALFATLWELNLDLRIEPGPKQW